MNSKKIFLNQRDLRSKLAEVVTSEWFQQALIYANDEMLEDGRVSIEGVRGARLFQQILINLPDEATELPPPLTTGLLPEPNLSRNAVIPKE